MADSSALAVAGMRIENGAFVADFDAMEVAARAYAAQFDGMEIKTEADRKAAKKIRTDINDRIKEIDRARIDLGRAYDRPKAEFDARCKAVMAILREQGDYVRDGLARKDAEFLADRERMLAEEYEGLAPQLAEVIPLRAYTDSNSRLLGRSTSDAAAARKLADMVEQAVADRAALAESGVEFAVEADMEFCRTLSLPAALAKNAALAAAKREREAHEQAMRELHRKVESAPEPDPAPQPAKEQPAEAAKRWAIEFAGTRAQAERVAACLREMGIRGQIRALGDV